MSRASFAWLKISSSDFSYTNESHEADRQDMDVFGINAAGMDRARMLESNSWKVRRHATD
jgi:hypothetical protein